MVTCPYDVGSFERRSSKDASAPSCRLTKSGLGSGLGSRLRSADKPCKLRLMSPHRLGFTAFAAAAVLASLAPAGSSLPREHARHSALPTIVGGLPAQRALLRRILTNMGPTRIVRVSFAGPDAAWRPVSENGVQLTFTAASRSDLLASWQAAVVGGVFAERSSSAHLPPVIVLQLPDGTGGRIGPPRRARTGLSRVTAKQAAALSERVRKAAGAAGAAVDELRVSRPYGLAFAIVFRVGDPAQFMKHRLPGFVYSFRDWTRYEGTYMRIVDRSGGFVWEDSLASRIGMISMRVRPDLAGCDPIPRHGVGEPPPCPAP